MSKLVRELRIYPGYDKRSNDPNKNYGVHGCEIVFYVHNPRRTKWVQFKCYTDWLPMSVQKEKLYDAVGNYKVTQEVVGEQPMAADLGYHSPKRKYKGQSRFDCKLVKGGHCYYDGSGLAAEQIRDAMLEGGDEAVWPLVESYWRDEFEPSVPTHPEAGKGQE